MSDASNERFRALRQAAKDAGLCIVCRRNPASQELYRGERRTTCDPCRDDHQAYKRRIKMQDEPPSEPIDTISV